MRQTFVCFALVVIASATVTAQAHTGDFEVGIDPTSNRILVEFDPDAFPWLLPPSEDPMLPGFALDDPGFVSLEDDEAEPGVFEPLNPNAIIRMQVLSVSSPEFKVWDPLGPGEDGFQIIGTRLWQLGSPHFDTHCWWHIDTTDPAYDPAHGPWSVTFRLLDAAQVHLPSDPITVTFLPEPASLVASLLALLVVRPRRSGNL
jgi:hypothetical protein